MLTFDELSKEQQDFYFRLFLSRWQGEYDGISMSFDAKTAALEKAQDNQDLLSLIYRGIIPDLELIWVKFLVNLQIFGGVGTWEDICAYSGEDPKNIVNRYGWINFYLYYNLLKVVKRGKGGRVFELGDSAQAIIDFAVSK